MENILIDYDTSNNQIIVSGNYDKLINNRRALRFLKDNTIFQQYEGYLSFEVDDSFYKTIERIKIASSYAKCQTNILNEANETLLSYIDEENRFLEFSRLALDIRNNNCTLEDFIEFKKALEKFMPARTLYDLQMLSAYHLAFAQNACNFSVPGSGKTSIVYGAYSYLKNLSENNPRKVDLILVICPLNAFNPWEMEFKECFARNPISKRITGQISIEERKQYFYETPAEITLISYMSVLSLFQEISFFLEKHKVMVILDEAHKIKNVSGGKTAQIILSLAKSCKSRVILTGTPAPNGYEDLYNLFKFIWPNKDLIKFQTGQLKDMSTRRDDPRVSKLLESISPFFIRIRKSDLNIPPAINNPPIIVEMGRIQRRIYEFIEKKYLFEIANNSDRKFQNILVRARLVRLMQAATNPILLRQPLEDFAADEGIDFSSISDDTRMLNEIVQYDGNETPSKYIAVKNLLNKIINSGGKAIVWAIYIKNIELLHRYLASEGIESRILYGATPIANNDSSEEDENYYLTREAIVNDFHKQDSSFKVIIANPVAVSESISLHKACHNAIYLERSFNAAHFIQSKDRIHRYGLSEDTSTNYYYFISKNTIDVTINDRLREKERRLMELIESMPIPLFNNVLDEDGDEDIKAVLKEYARRIKT